ncbi:MAG: tRNA (adenosine(37)-N6)-threonylcarbamoyltransferase complex dimerization subunit type 1 TsaB [Clostridia bacterium]|nr:tRNA (adenosine(37)-N6)-threonylcarbamoyltransferase complex dimerization subunit type 1 TsaB [Clostridia bacterium]
MNFLAIDTSGNYMTVVAVKDGEAFSCFLPDCSMRHSVSLMGAVEDALQKASLALEDCDFFAAVVGAGSFTGIRIGISAAKGFALAVGKPTLPVTSFGVAAYNAVNGGKTLCLVDAMHGSYYACGYENGGIVYPPSYLTEAEVLSLKTDGYALCSCEDLTLGGEKVERRDPVLGLEKAVKALAEKGEFGDLIALYVRKSSAELNAEKGV